MTFTFLDSVPFGANDTTTAVSFTGFASTIQIGDLIVIGVGVNGTAATIASVADNSSQAGTANSYTVRTTLTANNLTGVNIWTIATRSILTTDTISVTLGATSNRRSGLFMRFSGAVATSPLDVTAKVQSVTNTPITMGPTAALAGSGELAVGMSFTRILVPAPTFSDSTSGYNAVTFATSGGTVETLNTGGSYKLSAGTAAETDAHTWVGLDAQGGEGGAGELLTFIPAASAAVRSLGLLGVGS